MNDYSQKFIESSVTQLVRAAHTTVLGYSLLFGLVLGAISGWMFQSSADLRIGLDATWSEGRLRT